MPYLLPILALWCNAFFWGVSWLPFRAMHGAGLHPLWATALMYSLVSAGLLALGFGAASLLCLVPTLAMQRDDWPLIVRLLFRFVAKRDCSIKSNNCYGVWTRSQDRQRRCLEAQP